MYMCENKCDMNRVLAGDICDRSGERGEGREIRRPKAEIEDLTRRPQRSQREGAKSVGRVFRSIGPDGVAANETALGTMNMAGSWADHRRVRIDSAV
jgi:hypothetical protein